jgi:hypothetical protein
VEDLLEEYFLFHQFHLVHYRHHLNLHYLLLFHQEQMLLLKNLNCYRYRQLNRQLQQLLET